MTDLQALSDAATPGPWVVQQPGENDPGAGTIYIDTHYFEGGPEPVVAPSYPIGVEDAAYIVALVNAHREGRLAASPSPDTDREPMERCCTSPGCKCRYAPSQRGTDHDHARVGCRLRPSPDTDAGLDEPTLTRILNRLAPIVGGDLMTGGVSHRIGLSSAIVEELRVARLATPEKGQPV